jgi:hypothetical protein
MSQFQISDLETEMMPCNQDGPTKAGAAILVIVWIVLA